MDLTGMDLLRSQRGLMTRIAAELGIERGAVAMWKKIPPERVPEVERITGYPRHQLRPDLWDAPVVVRQ
jgi:DNA-binding transcriptional regulator YdaS (Cro superfamily)